MQEEAFVFEQVERIRGTLFRDGQCRITKLETELVSAKNRTRDDERIGALIAHSLLISESKSASPDEAVVRLCLEAWDQLANALNSLAHQTKSSELRFALEKISATQVLKTLRYQWISRTNHHPISRLNSTAPLSATRRLLADGEIYLAWCEGSKLASEEPMASFAYSLLLDSVNLAAHVRKISKTDKPSNLRIERSFLILLARGETSIVREPGMIRKIRSLERSHLRELILQAIAPGSMGIARSWHLLGLIDERFEIEDQILAIAVLARLQRQSRKFQLAEASELLYHDLRNALAGTTRITNDTWNLLKSTLKPEGGPIQVEATPNTSLKRWQEGASLSWKIASILGPRRMSQLLTGRLKLSELSPPTIAKISNETVTYLGRLKGPMMKLGQTASYFSAGLPKNFSAGLQNLQSEAEPIGWDIVEATLARGFGPNWAKNFLDFETRPIAVGSVAQVHRAKLTCGAPVAVKVRLPDIQAIIRSDMVLLRGLSHLALAFPAKKFLAELERQMLSECDFRKEAGAMNRSRRRFKDDPFIHIPKVYDELTKEDVIVQELVSGLSLNEAIAQGEGDQKNRWGEALVRFVVTSCRDADFNSDPHPGNFVFSDSGLHCLDFGSTIEWGPEEKKTWNLLINACTEKSFSMYRQAFKIDDDDTHPAHRRQFDAIVGGQRGGWTYPGPQALSADVIADQLHIMSETIAENEKSLRVEFAPVFLFGMRVYFGHLSVVAELGSIANWNEIARTIMSSKDAH